MQGFIEAWGGISPPPPPPLEKAPPPPRIIDNQGLYVGDGKAPQAEVSLSQSNHNFSEVDSLCGQVTGEREGMGSVPPKQKNCMKPWACH